MEDTIAAISTSTVSSGGISIVRISGPDAIIIGDKVFKSKKNKDYGIIIHDGGSSFITIKFCPWCGKKLT